MLNLGQPAMTAILFLKRAAAAFALTPLALPAAAQAARADSISAPSDIALFALGVAGLLFGRRLARRRKRRDDED